MIIYKDLTKKQQTRYDRIIETTEELIHEKGFYKLSLSELTETLRISRSTIYENFGSKEGIVEKVVENFSRRLDEGLQSVIENKSLNTIEKFIAVAKTQGKILNGKSDHRLLNDLRVHLPYLYKQFEKGRKRRELNGYKVLVDQGIKEGLFDSKLPPDFLLQLYLKMGQLVSDTNLLENTSMNKENAMEIIVKIYLNGTKKMDL